MPYEVKMYAILAVVWLILRMTGKYRSNIFKLAVVAYALSSGIYIIAGHFYFPSVSYFAKLSFMFFTGAAFYVLKEHIHFSRSLFLLILIAISSAIQHEHMFYVVYMLSIAYLVFFLAYIPSGYIRKYNLAGDYSYGIYIYAFPVQQSVAALFPEVSVVYMILISAAATILLGAISWHLLERRFLSLKGHCVDNTRRLLSFSLTSVSTRTR